MIHHHPDDDWLMGLAGGTLPRGHALVVDAHVEHCAQCRTRVRTFEALGGALLEATPPALMAPEALSRTLTRLDGDGAAPIVAPPVAAPTSAGMQASLPGGAAWPRSMQGCSSTPWRWLGPGMRWARVHVADEPDANVFLLRIAAGKSLPAHTHSGAELTQILCGRFHDGRALFDVGDFDATDGSVHHQPVVQPEGECICIASVSGKVMFDGAIARVLGSLVGM